VVHIQVQDQAPAQLTRQQVRLLYNAVAGNSMDSVKLGFQVILSSPLPHPFPSSCAAHPSRHDPIIRTNESMSHCVSAFPLIIVNLFVL
jgi:hypothetical protein